MISLCDLPDELLLEVVGFLEAIRSHDTQSTAFKDRNVEKARQRENNFRQQALHALCLTSHRLWRLSSPVLYSSSITCASSSGLRGLQLMHGTLTRPNHTSHRTNCLFENLKYIENRLADHKGNSLQADDAFQQGPMTTYFQLLARLVSLAPKIEHICIVSLEHDDVSLWTHLLDPSQGFFVHNGNSRLRCLVAQIHAHGWSASPDISVSELLIQNLPSFPMLQDLRISGATTHRAGTLPLVVNRTLNLRRLDLIENTLDIDDVADLLLACKDIRHFTCRWAFYNDVYVDPSVLHEALLTHAHTLETLSIDWREVKFLLSNDANSKLLGSLRHLKTLKSIVVSDLGFLTIDRSLLDFPDHVLSHPLANLLPESLQRMTLLTDTTGYLNHNNALDENVCLRDLARDCRSSMLGLQTLFVKAPCDLFAPNLANIFEQAGIRLCLQKETWH